MPNLPCTLRVGLAALCVVLAACPNDRKGVGPGVVDAGPRELAEKEPNDRPDQALALTESAFVQASLSADPSKVDEDWYALSAPAPRTVDVAVSGVPGGDVMIEVTDADRNRLAVANSEGEGKPERLPNLGVSGRMLVKVTSARKGAGGAYKLTVLFKEREGGAEVEPNDRAVDANALQLGQSTSGYLGHAGDEDWFRFELGPGGEAGAGPASSEPDAGPPSLPPTPEAAAALDAGTGADAGAPVEDPRVALRIDLGAVEGVKLEVAVLSAAEAPLFQSKGKEGEALSLRNVGVRATDRIIYVVVKGGWVGAGKEARRSFSADKPYSLTVAQEDAGTNAELEPNDEVAKATPLPRDGFREGFLAPKSDVDYFLLRSPEPSLVRVQLGGVERLDLVLSVVKPGDAGEQVVAKANDGAVKEPEQLNNVSCVGECWFKVEGGLRKVDGKMVRDFENAEVPYRLSVTTLPDTGAEEREPNAAADIATPIAIGRPIRGTIHPKRDVDYYRLDLSGKPVKTPLRITLTGILKVDVGLYVHELDDEGKPSLVQTADRAKGDAPEVVRYSADPGVYLLEVRDAKNREANFQDSYQLTVEEAEP